MAVDAISGGAAELGESAADVSGMILDNSEGDESEDSPSVVSGAGAGAGAATLAQKPRSFFFNLARPVVDPRLAAAAPAADFRPYEAMLGSIATGRMSSWLDSQVAQPQRSPEMLVGDVKARAGCFRGGEFSLPAPPLERAHDLLAWGSPPIDARSTVPTTSTSALERPAAVAALLALERAGDAGLSTADLSTALAWPRRKVLDLLKTLESDGAALSSIDRHYFAVREGHGEPTLEETGDPAETRPAPTRLPLQSPLRLFFCATSAEMNDLRLHAPTRVAPPTLRESSDEKKAVEPWEVDDGRRLKSMLRSRLPATFARPTTTTPDAIVLDVSKPRHQGPSMLRIFGDATVSDAQTGAGVAATGAVDGADDGALAKRAHSQHVSDRLSPLADFPRSVWLQAPKQAVLTEVVGRIDAKLRKKRRRQNAFSPPFVDDGSPQQEDDGGDVDGVGDGGGGGGGDDGEEMKDDGGAKPRVLRRAIPEPFFVADIKIPAAILDLALKGPSAENDAALMATDECLSSIDPSYNTGWDGIVAATAPGPPRSATPISFADVWREVDPSNMSRRRMKWTHSDMILLRNAFIEDRISQERFALQKFVTQRIVWLRQSARFHAIGRDIRPPPRMIACKTRWDLIAEGVGTVDGPTCHRRMVYLLKTNLTFAGRVIRLIAQRRAEEKLSMTLDDIGIALHPMCSTATDVAGDGDGLDGSDEDDDAEDGAAGAHVAPSESAAKSTARGRYAGSSTAYDAAAGSSARNRLADVNSSSISRHVFDWSRLSYTGPPVPDALARGSTPNPAHPPWGGADDTEAAAVARLEILSALLDLHIASILPGANSLKVEGGNDDVESATRAAFNALRAMGVPLDVAGPALQRAGIIVKASLTKHVTESFSVQRALGLTLLDEIVSHTAAGADSAVDLNTAETSTLLLAAGVIVTTPTALSAVWSTEEVAANAAMQRRREREVEEVASDGVGSVGMGAGAAELTESTVSLSRALVNIYDARRAALRAERESSESLPERSGDGVVLAAPPIVSTHKSRHIDSKRRDRLIEEPGFSYAVSVPPELCAIAPLAFDPPLWVRVYPGSASLIADAAATVGPLVAAVKARVAGGDGADIHTTGGFSLDDTALVSLVEQHAPASFASLPPFLRSVFARAAAGAAAGVMRAPGVVSGGDVWRVAGGGDSAGATAAAGAPWAPSVGRGVRVRVLMACARAALVIALEKPGISEAEFILSLPAVIPPASARVLLRWLSVAGILSRSWTLSDALPPRPTLWSSATAPAPDAPPRELTVVLTAIAGSSVPATLPLAEIVLLWESSHALVRTPTAPAMNSTLTVALLEALESTPASLCPLAGLTTRYAAPADAIIRFASLAREMNVLTTAPTADDATKLFDLIGQTMSRAASPDAGAGAGAGAGTYGGGEFGEGAEVDI